LSFIYIYYREEDWQAIFSQFDQGISGFITAEDIQRGLDAHQIRYNTHCIQNMIRDTDKDHDGKISYQEFRGAWKKHYTYQ